MTHYYCPCCEKKAIWDKETKGYRCTITGKYLTEDEMYMLDDDMDELENHL